MLFDINPQKIKFLLVGLPLLLLFLTCHELAHGYIAWRLGDPTARKAGRLSLNPLRHLDPMGVLAFILAGFGWAKPVPINPVFFHNPRQGLLVTALAGPVANIFLALISAILWQAAGWLPFSSGASILRVFLQESVWINVMLAVFNLIPLPPLDGSKVLMGLLPPRAAYTYSRFEPYGFFLILLLCVTGLLNKIIVPPILFLTTLLLG